MGYVDAYMDSKANILSWKGKWTRKLCTRPFLKGKMVINALT